MKSISDQVACYFLDTGLADPYTIVFKKLEENSQGMYLAADDKPLHPQGFGQHGWSRGRVDCPTWKHLGRRIKFSELPLETQKFVEENL